MTEPSAVTRVDGAYPPSRRVFSRPPASPSREAADQDRQHERLIALIRELVESDRTRAPKREMSDMLDDLSLLTRQHFRAEEECMQAARYARVDIHALIHSRLLTKLHEHIHAFKTGPGRLSCAFLSFLEFWLAAHIGGVDQHFARHLETSNAEATRAPL